MLEPHCSMDLYLCAIEMYACKSRLKCHREWAVQVHKLRWGAVQGHRRGDRGVLWGAGLAAREGSSPLKRPLGASAGAVGRRLLAV